MSSCDVRELVLRMQIMALKGGGGGGGRQEAASELINLNVRETEASCSENNSSEINGLDVSRPDPAAGESPAMNSYRGGLPFYASAAARADIHHQLLHSGGQPSPAAAAPPKMELAPGSPPATAGGGGGTFGSLLCGAAVDEQPPFWSWADGHHTCFQ